MIIHQNHDITSLLKHKVSQANSRRKTLNFQLFFPLLLRAASLPDLGLLK